MLPINRVTAVWGAIALAVTLVSVPTAKSHVLDLGITDGASYAAAIDAISASEYVKYDYSTNPRPRIAGVVAALMEFATRNPLATEAQLTAFVQTYAASLLAATPGDPELRRSAIFLPAMFFTTPIIGVRGGTPANAFWGALYVAPADLPGDGSFTYTPDPGYTGTDFFTYRTGTSVAGLGCTSGAALRGGFDEFVYSNPATVAIIVSAAVPPPCLGDANDDSLVNFDDITTVLANWLSACP